MAEYVDNQSTTSVVECDLPVETARTGSFACGVAVAYERHCNVLNVQRNAVGIILDDWPRLEGITLSFQPHKRYIEVVEGGRTGALR